MTTVWCGTAPQKDDFGMAVKEVFIDGRTVFGSWAIMTPASFKKHGVGLGVGKGQKYMKQADGSWAKQRS